MKHRRDTERDRWKGGYRSEREGGKSREGSESERRKARSWRGVVSKYTQT